MFQNYPRKHSEPLHIDDTYKTPKIIQYSLFSLVCCMISSNCRNTFYNRLCWSFSTEALPCESSSAQTKKGPTQHTSSLALHSHFSLVGLTGWGLFLT
ncbi:hypothetical protein K435DRAFT_108309 [Dendrothele bispora CBS 962.96]|uniref:Uncharacterized protein n=1 Tax=Dendrothele bispora (strain CBS 962.96) TaxID=1314807 RepID=A0A4S8M2G2_DENBC|nr:hypothetical protein K435DRAFT_108309 [Dendrothele bispora CBS 962.96]